MGAFFQIYRYWYTDLLLEVKFYIVSKHLPDDSDKLVGTMPKCIIVRPVLSPLGIIVCLEGCGVSNNVQAALTRAYLRTHEPRLDIQVVLA